LWSSSLPVFGRLRLFLHFSTPCWFPNRDIQHIVRALEGRETLREESTPLVRGTIDTFGHLRRAIQVGAYFYASAEQTLKESHTTKRVEVSYLAWLEKRSKPTILAVRRTEIDGSLVRFETDEASPFAIIRAYLLPVLALVFAVVLVSQERPLLSQGANAMTQMPLRYGV
jgi:hypothetical protein